MRKLLFPFLGLVLLVVPVLAQDLGPRAILKKAINAEGGEKLLSKFAASHSRSKGKIHLGVVRDFTSEEDVQLPDKFKSVLQLEADGKTYTITQVFDGNKGWAQFMDKTIDLDDQMVNELKEILHAARVANFTETLTDKNFKLASLGEVKVKGKDAVGVRVSYAGRRDVNLYFDKASGLLVKTEGRGLDPLSKQEVNQEKFFTDYHDVQGRKIPHKVEVQHDGKVFIEAEVLELRLLDKHDASTFNKP
jgi:hypothetical protein